MNINERYSRKPLERLVLSLPNHVWPKLKKSIASFSCTWRRKWLIGSFATRPYLKQSLSSERSCSLTGVAPRRLSVSCRFRSATSRRIQVCVPCVRRYSPYFGPRESQSPRCDASAFQDSVAGYLNGARHVASPSAVTQKFAVNGVVVCKSFSAAFTLKHRERKQASARRHGGLLLRRSAPTGSWFLPLRRPLQESRPWHLGAASHSRPPGGVP